MYVWQNCANIGNYFFAMDMQIPMSDKMGLLIKLKY